MHSVQRDAGRGLLCSHAAGALSQAYTQKVGFTLYTDPLNSKNDQVLVLDVASMVKSASLVTPTVKECEAYCTITPGCAGLCRRRSVCCTHARMAAGGCRHLPPAPAEHACGCADLRLRRLDCSCNAYDFCDAAAGCGAYCIDHNQRNPAGRLPAGAAGRACWAPRT
jgi:hypothetical protein